MTQKLVQAAYKQYMKDPDDDEALVRLLVATDNPKLIAELGDFGRVLAHTTLKAEELLDYEDDFEERGTKKRGPQGNRTHQVRGAANRKAYLVKKFDAK